MRMCWVCSGLYVANVFIIVGPFIISKGFAEMVQWGVKELLK
jgi:hypothetical protein